MSGCCQLCGQPWGTHGTACRKADALYSFTQTDHTDDTPQEATIRRIVREELQRFRSGVDALPGVKKYG